MSEEAVRPFGFGHPSLLRPSNNIGGPLHASTTDAVIIIPVDARSVGSSSRTAAATRRLDLGEWRRYAPLVAGSVGRAVPGPLAVHAKEGPSACARLEYY